MARKKREPTTDAVRRRKAGDLRYIGTHIDASVLKQLKIESIRRDITIGEIVSDALTAYLPSLEDASA